MEKPYHLGICIPDHIELFESRSDAFRIEFLRGGQHIISGLKIEIQQKKKRRHNKMDMKISQVHNHVEEAHRNNLLQINATQFCSKLQQLSHNFILQIASFEWKGFELHLKARNNTLFWKPLQNMVCYIVNGGQYLRVYEINQTQCEYFQNLTIQGLLGSALPAGQT